MQQWRRFKQTSTLAERLAAEAVRLRKLAENAVYGTERDLLTRRSDEYDAANTIGGYLKSVKLQPPKR